jgi:hypothetical protein
MSKLSQSIFDIVRIMVAYINEYQWYQSYAQANIFNDNAAKRELFLLARRLDGQSPEARMELSKQGMAFAQKHSEPFWYLYYAKFQAEAMHELRLYHDWLEFATRLVVELRKPEFEACPMIAAIYLQLIGAYYYHDPIGNSQAILDSITYLEKNTSFSIETHLALCNYRCEVFIAIEAWNEAKDACRNYQALTENNQYHLWQSASNFCQTAYQLKDKHYLINQSQILLTANINDESQRRFHIAGLYWQAVHAIMTNDKYKRIGATDRLISAQNDRDISKPSEITVTAMFYYAKESNVNLFQFISNYADTNIKSPYRSALHALRIFYLVAQLPYMEQIRYAGIRGLQKVNLFVRFVSWVVKLPKLWKRLMGIVIMVTWAVAGLVMMLLKPPLKEATLRVREYSKTSTKPEFFEERLRWIEEKKANYIP